MSRITFDQLPDSARLWVFAADRPLELSECEALQASVEAGLAGWSAHGSPVTWGYVIERTQFLLVGVDETHTALSGCSIDGAVRQIRALQSRLGVELLDNARVFYRDEGRIRAVPRPVFRSLAEAGKITRDTLVYNNILATVGEYRRGQWEIPVRDSWHAAAFPVRA